jgi:hypothetical protein
MMIDAPGYDADGKDDAEIVLTESNSEDIINYVNGLI